MGLAVFSSAITRASEGSTRGMGGGQTNAGNSHTPQMRGERGRGRGYRTPDARRNTIIHTQLQEAMDDNSRYALLIARRETLRTTTTLYCHQRWIASRTIMGYGAPSPAAAQEGHPDDGPTEQERSTPSEPTSVRQTPLTPTTNTRSITARQLQMDDLPSTQGHGTGGAIVGHQHCADDPLPPMYAGPTSVASLGADRPKSTRPDD